MTESCQKFIEIVTREQIVSKPDDLINELTWTLSILEAQLLTKILICTQLNHVSMNMQT